MKRLLFVGVAVGVLASLTAVLLLLNSFEVGAYTLVTRGRAAAAQIPDGFYVVVTSPTYGYDPNTGAYATFDAIS